MVTAPDINMPKTTRRPDMSRKKDPNGIDNRSTIRRFLSEHPDQEFFSVDIAAGTGIAIERVSEILPIIFSEGFVDKRNESPRRMLWKYRKPSDIRQCDFHKFMMKAKPHEHIRQM